MAKKVSAIISSATSEVAKDMAVAAAGANEGAATVVRDANGRVIRVDITLPDSAAAQAKLAIAATPGVANVIVGDITPGTVGFDGTLALPDVSASITQVVNADGTLSISCGPSTIGTWNYSSALPYNVMGSKFELKAKFLTNPTGHAYMTVGMADDVQSIFGIIHSYDTDEENPYRIRVSHSGPGAEFVLDNFDLDVFHTFALEILAGNAGKNVYLDGSLIGSSNGSGSPSGPSINISLLLDNNATFIVDYMRWTAVV